VLIDHPPPPQREREAHPPLPLGRSPRRIRVIWRHKPVLRADIEHSLEAMCVEEYQRSRRVTSWIRRPRCASRVACKRNVARAGS
jgi:hypothetical protein